MTCLRALSAAAVLLAPAFPFATAAFAQGWTWGDNGYVQRSSPSAGPAPVQGNWGNWNYNRPAWQNPSSGSSSQVPDYGAPNYGAPNYGGPDYRTPDYRPAPQLQSTVRDGGDRPDIMPVAPPVRAFPYNYPANSIVIDSGGKQLYYVLAGGRAYVYVISVGREGFDWHGTEVVSRKQAWPDWHPPAEMRARDPSLPEKMTGGLKNPLGAMALYLGTTLYRIHGTNDERTLGQAQSSGCFRMMNSAVLHLASITEVGTRVQVVQSLEPARVSQAQPAVPPTASNGQPAYRANSAPRRWSEDRYVPEWDFRAYPRSDYARPDYPRSMYDRWR